MFKLILYKLFRIEEPPCASCETLKYQLEIANYEKKELLQTILSFSKPAAPEPRVEVDYEKVKPKMMTWNVRRQMLEAEDRKTAELLAKKKSIGEQIADLEKEVGLELNEGEKTNA